MDRSEVYRIGRIFLQLLSQLQNVIVHGARGRIILIAPDFIQQFVAGNYSLRIPHHGIYGNCGNLPKGGDAASLLRISRA